jgi:hypothetical protein
LQIKRGYGILRGKSITFGGITMDFSRYFRDYPTPDGFYGPYGGAQLSPELKEAFEEIIMSSNSVEWRYTCYEYSDPANPYSLTVYFDSEGKCTNVEFEPIPGG